MRPGYTDLRKAAKGLTVLVQDRMNLDPLNGSVYLFCNRGRKLLKAAWRDKTGFWLAQKRLERERFPFEKKVTVLERENKTLAEENKTLEQENGALQEKLKLALFRQFGRHAEKFAGEGQLPLFDAGEDAAPKTPAAPEEQETVGSYNRTKRGRKPIGPTIPRVEEIIDLPEAEQQCACGKKLTCVGEDVTERLAIIPGQVYVIQYHVKKYACHDCEGSGDGDKPAVRAGKAPENSIPGSMATPELLSYVFAKKYCDYVQYYRQEAAFFRIGATLSRMKPSDDWEQRLPWNLSQ